jgi:hypothetical protein
VATEEQELAEKKAVLREAFAERVTLGFPEDQHLQQFAGIAGAL